ncbi:hypothetical protein D3C72_2198150 [compost metagenome]
MPDFWCEELFRPVIGFGLNVLTERQRHRSTICWIGHCAESARQGCQKLFWTGDAIKIAAYRAETVIDGHCAVVEILDLL